tara:strand:- start:2733 stop:2954 length:222 start_codon:yes stop_codon:yes gene_type:complete
MSRISKRKLMKALKGELEVPTMSDTMIFDMFKNPPSQEEWLKGYKRWVQQQDLTALPEIEKLIKKPKRKKKRC